MKHKVPKRKNWLYQYRNLLYLVAIAVGCLAGIFVGEPSPEKPFTPSYVSLPLASTTPRLGMAEKGIPQSIPKPIPQLLLQSLFQSLQMANPAKVALKQPIQPEMINQGAEFKAPLEFQGKVVNSVAIKDNCGNHNCDRRVIALTFDDGPWSTTPKVLEILKENKISATFFMIGKHLQAYPQIAKQVVAGGHAIGNHTWNHGYGKYTPAAATAEIQRTNDLLYQITKVRTGLFRPPAGILNNGLADYSRSQKGTVILWSNDSLDWRSPLPQTMVNNVLKNARSGGIVLLHDGGGDRSRTITALPGIIRELKIRGYEFVTIPQLLEINTQTPK